MLNNRYTILITAILLNGCSLSMNTTGSMTMLKGEAPIQPLPIEQVQLILTTEKQDYQVVALITASVSATEPEYIAVAEGKALQELKHQAAQAGANGVIDVVREVLVGGALASTTSFGYIDDHSIGNRNILDIEDHLQREHNVVSSSQTSVSRSYTVYFRGKAVRLEK
ncbi:hypothetical protein MNBD_GAMMA16-2005 [hydrothermal vent metagenome]|uniref:Uncharacterized protein n=1 Tax=hydrothermal vent metagenome TaxID=652676 RepID=A0A3B0YUS9_9ZZZZ